ncbi:MAG: hypothetical protein IKJ99_00460 [Oscillospiraceae bacterium]|nr:hypothetical protein [Oscillospiraceae bacterium]
MIYATKIKMRAGCRNSQMLTEIDSMVSIYREKYVKSEPNQYGDDNLLCLPRV